MNWSDCYIIPYPTLLILDLVVSLEYLKAEPGCVERLGVSLIQGHVSAWWYDLLIMSRSKILHSYGDITIADEGLQRKWAHKTEIRQECWHTKKTEK